MIKMSLLVLFYFPRACTKAQDTPHRIRAFFFFFVKIYDILHVHFLNNKLVLDCNPV